MKLRTEFNFTLPVGLSDENGNIMKTSGTMKLAKVKDIINIYKDIRIANNPSYFYVILLARAIIKLGNEKIINAKIIENLSPKDFVFLIDFFNEINHHIISNVPIECSQCNKKYIGEVALVGEL